jgi:hypothetical protein
MPLSKEFEAALPLIAEMSDDEQKELARQISLRAAAIDHARTLTTPELMKLMDLAMTDLTGRVNDLKK